MLLIGSHALKYHYPFSCFPQDVDIIATEDEIIKWLEDKDCKFEKKEFSNLTVYLCYLDNTLYEFEVAENDNSGMDYLNYCSNIEHDLIVAPVEVLFSIKKSHINQEKNFGKHIVSYHYLKNIINNDTLNDITKKREKETIIRYNSKTPSLKKNVNDFVTESQKFVKRIYDHDDLHNVVAHYNEPLYTKMQTEEESVWCEKDMWMEFNKTDKIKCVLEEAYVITLERKIIPMLFQQKVLMSTEKAVMWSIMRICTTLTSGWFRAFVVENYFDIVDNIDYSFVDKFFNKHSKGEIKTYSD